MQGVFEAFLLRGNLARRCAVQDGMPLSKAPPSSTEAPKEGRRNDRGGTGIPEDLPVTRVFDEHSAAPCRQPGQREHSQVIRTGQPVGQAALVQAMSRVSKDGGGKQREKASQHNWAQISRWLFHKLAA